MFPSRRPKQKAFVLLATLGVLILLSLITVYALEASLQSNKRLLRSINHTRLKQAALSVVELNKAGLQVCDSNTVEPYLPKGIAVKVECSQGVIKVRAMTTGTESAYFTLESALLVKSVESHS